MKKKIENFSILRLLGLILSDDKRFAYIVIMYGVVVSLLTLSVPFSVQLLIEMVTSTGRLDAVITLAVVLLILLLLSALFYSLQLYAVELFERRFFSRICSEITARTLHANPKEIQNFNLEELQNRYFEIMVISSRLPSLLIGSFTMLETTVVGFAIVSFYHPFFFYFLTGYSICLFLVWLLFHRSALKTALENSSNKYEMASWLESLAKNNYFFRGDKKIAFAIKKSNHLSDVYLDSYRRHFNIILSQNIGFLLLYALGSAGLLGLGGILIIKNQLTIGQLVAAELVVSVIFLSLSRIGLYLEMYYEVCAGLSKLSSFFHLDLEKINLKAKDKTWKSSLQFENVSVFERNETFSFNIEFPESSTTLVAVDRSIISRLFINLVLVFREKEKGVVWYGEYEQSDIDVQVLRDQIAVVDNLIFPESTISEFLKIGAPDVTQADIIKTLKAFDLFNVIESLPEKFDQRLMPNGSPLSSDEILRLKIAQAIITEPKIIIISQLFDILQVRHRLRIIQYIKELKTVSLICFSNRRDIEVFEHYYYLESNQSHYYKDVKQLISHDVKNIGHVT